MSKKYRMSEIEKEDYDLVDVGTPIDDVCRVYVDYFWWCEYGNPKRALFYKGKSAQCSKDRKVLERYGTPYKECEIVQIPVAYREWTD